MQLVAGRPSALASREWLLLGVIVVVGATARSYRLDTSLWYDEINTLVDFVRLPTRDVVRSLESNNHIFFTLQAKAAIALFTESAWSLRLPAALFGLASIVAVWALARRMAGPVVALAVAFLLAISPDHVSYSQTARGYTGLLFWTTCATLLFARGVGGGGSGRRTWTLYAICIASASYTHLSALFLFLAHGIVYVTALLLVRKRPEDRSHAYALAGAGGWQPLFGFATATALTLLLYAPVLYHMPALVESMGVHPGTPSEWRDASRLPQQFAMTLSSAGGLAPFILAAGIVAFVTGVPSLTRRAPVISAVYLLHVPLTAAILVALNARIWPRFFLVDLGFVYVAVVQGTFVLCRHVAQRVGDESGVLLRTGIVTAAAVIVMTAGSLSLLATNYAHPREDFAGAAAYVEPRRGPLDAVAALGPAAVAVRLYAPDWTAVNSVAALDRLRQSAPRTWLVVRKGPPLPSAFGKIIESDFEFAARIPGMFPEGDIVIYRSR